MEKSSGVMKQSSFNTDAEILDATKQSHKSRCIVTVTLRHWR